MAVPGPEPASPSTTGSDGLLALLEAELNDTASQDDSGAADAECAAMHAAAQRRAHSSPITVAMQYLLRSEALDLWCCRDQQQEPATPACKRRRIAGPHVTAAAVLRSSGIMGNAPRPAEVESILADCVYCW